MNLTGDTGRNGWINDVLRLHTACFGAADRAGFFLSATRFGATCSTAFFRTAGFTAASRTATGLCGTGAQGNSGNGNDGHQG